MKATLLMSPLNKMKTNGGLCSKYGESLQAFRILVRNPERNSQETKTKLRGLSSLTNYTGRATAPCRLS
jgi:hypothetical protein